MVVLSEGTISVEDGNAYVIDKYDIRKELVDDFWLDYDGIQVSIEYGQFGDIILDLID